MSVMVLSPTGRLLFEILKFDADAFWLLSRRQLHNRDVVLEAVRSNSHCMRFVTARARMDKDFTMAAALVRPWFGH